MIDWATSVKCWHYYWLSVCAVLDGCVGPEWCV